MEEIIELFVGDIEIIFKEKLSQLGYSNCSFFMIIDMFEGIIRLNILDLFSNDFHNSKAFEDLNHQRDEMTFNFSC